MIVVYNTPFESQLRILKDKFDHLNIIQKIYNSNIYTSTTISQVGNEHLCSIVILHRFQNDLILNINLFIYIKSIYLTLQDCI